MRYYFQRFKVANTVQLLSQLDLEHHLKALNLLQTNMPSSDASSPVPQIDTQHTLTLRHTLRSRVVVGKLTYQL